MNELDLHGERHPEVTMQVENFVLLNKTPLKIITGRSDRMIELATNPLRRNSFKWVIHSHNPGVIIVLGGEKYEAK